MFFKTRMFFFRVFFSVEGVVFILSSFFDEVFFREFFLFRFFFDEVFLKTKFFL